MKFELTEINESNVNDFVRSEDLFIGKEYYITVGDEDVANNTIEAISYFFDNNHIWYNHSDISGMTLIYSDFIKIVIIPRDMIYFDEKINEISALLHFTPMRVNSEEDIAERYLKPALDNFNDYRANKIKEDKEVCTIYPPTFLISTEDEYLRDRMFSIIRNQLDNDLFEYYDPYEGTITFLGSDVSSCKCIKSDIFTIIIATEYDGNYPILYGGADIIYRYNRCCSLSDEYNTITKVADIVTVDNMIKTALNKYDEICEYNKKKSTQIIKDDDSEGKRSDYKERFLMLQLEGVDDKEFNSIMNEIQILLDNSLQDGDVMDYKIFDTQEI